MKNRIANIFSAAGWFALFFATQILVTCGYIFIKIFSVAFAARGDVSDMDALMQQVLDSTLADSMMITLASYVVFLLIFALIFALRRKSPLDACHLFPAPGKALLLPVVAAFGLYLCSNLGLMFVPLPKVWMDSLSTYSQEIVGGGFLLYVLGVMLGAPIIEEIVFRGLVYSRLRRAMPYAAAVLISALLFGVIHFSGSPLLMLPALLLGIVNAITLEKTRSLLPCIAAHFAANLSSLLQGPLSGLPTAALAAICLVLLAAAVAATFLLIRRPGQFYEGVPAVPLLFAKTPNPAPAAQAPTAGPDVPRYQGM